MAEANPQCLQICFFFRIHTESHFFICATTISFIMCFPLILNACIFLWWPSPSTYGSAVSPIAWPCYYIRVCGRDSDMRVNIITAMIMKHQFPPDLMLLSGNWGVYRQKCYDVCLWGDAVVSVSFVSMCAGFWVRAWVCVWTGGRLCLDSWQLSVTDDVSILPL